jgi:hypothetical protein
MKGLPAKYGGLQGGKKELAQWKLHERLGGSLEEYAMRAAAAGFAVRFWSIMNQFSHFCVPYGVSKLAALA